MLVINENIQRLRAWRVLILAIASVLAGPMRAGEPIGPVGGAAGTARPLQASKMPQPGAPDLEKLPQPVQQRLDLAAVARGFDAAVAAAAAQALAKGPQLLVFVSLTMPEGSLRKLIEQGERTRATIVLRGLKDGSMVKTAAAVRQILGNYKTAVQIDPQGFDRFGVNQVPTFILLKDGAQLQRCDDTSCVSPSSYAEVSGDATIEYALEWIEKRAPSFNREAKVLLQRFRE